MGNSQGKIVNYFKTNVITCQEILPVSMKPTLKLQCYIRRKGLMQEQIASRSRLCT